MHITLLEDQFFLASFYT